MSLTYLLSHKNHYINTKQHGNKDTKETAKCFNLMQIISNMHTTFSSYLDSQVTFQDIKAIKL